MVLCFQVAACNIRLEMKNENFNDLRGEIRGPPDTPYENGRFVLDILIPETYPFHPPKVSLSWCQDIIIHNCFQLFIYIVSLMNWIFHSH